MKQKFKVFLVLLLALILLLLFFRLFSHRHAHSSEMEPVSPPSAAGDAKISPAEYLQEFQVIGLTVTPCEDKIGEELQYGLRMELSYELPPPQEELTIGISLCYPEPWQSVFGTSESGITIVTLYPDSHYSLHPEKRFAVFTSYADNASRSEVASLLETAESAQVKLYHYEEIWTEVLEVEHQA